MMLSLAHRIATTKPEAMWGCVAERDKRLIPFVGDRLQEERDVISRSVHFRINAVAEFAQNGGIDYWENLPNLAPPFKRMFFEWGSEKEQYGCLIRVQEIGEWSTAAEQNWLEWIALWGFAPIPDPAMILGHLKASRWVLMCSPWMTVFGSPIEGRPIWTGCLSSVCVSSAGKYVSLFAPAPLFPKEADYERFLYGVPSTVGLALSFCHCKNVSRVESVDDRGERWHRRTGAPRLKYYTLNINPMREVLRTEGKSEQVGLKRALHICRGHFATYTEEKPLFGRYAGTFWKPDHVRGTTESGIVAKDYSVSVN